MQTRKHLRLLTLVIVVLMAAAGCVPQTVAPEATDAPTQAAATEATATDSADVPVVKIGFVWPLTGNSATIGQQHSDVR
jgi:hypothetical protein